MGLGIGLKVVVGRGLRTCGRGGQNRRRADADAFLANARGIDEGAESTNAIIIQSPRGRPKGTWTGKVGGGTPSHARETRTSAPYRGTEEEEATSCRRRRLPSLTASNF